MQKTFAGLAILALVAGIAVRNYAPGLGLVQEDPDAIANCFLAMAIAYAATIFIWDWLFDPEKLCDPAYPARIASRLYVKNGLLRRSVPMVLPGPCPQMNMKSSPSVNSLVLMALISASWLP